MNAPHPTAQMRQQLYRDMDPHNLTQLANRDGNAMNGTDARELSDAEMLGRRQIADVASFLKEVPGFEKSYIVDIAPQVGIRETRRVSRMPTCGAMSTM